MQGWLNASETWPTSVFDVPGWEVANQRGQRVNGQRGLNGDRNTMPLSPTRENHKM